MPPEPDAETLPTLQVVGDGIDGQWCTWRWSDSKTVGVARCNDATSLIARLRAALPARVVRELGDLKFFGELCDPKQEYELMALLGQRLLPEKLRQEILQRWQEVGRFTLRIAPSPATAIVPWWLLVVAEGVRLIDIANISLIGPLLPRDIDAEAVQPRPWEPEGHALYVVDPLTADHRIHPVLSVAAKRDWLRRLDSQGRVLIHRRVTREDLSDELRQHPARLMLVGHCLSSEMAGDTGFMLSDSPDTDTRATAAGQTTKVLTGADVVLGTQHVPDGEPGYKKWPMPPRVAIMACASGTDLSDHEPFGLATAALINGAEVVHATLWPLPTDQAFALAGVNYQGFSETAYALDQVQSALDPVSALCQWQRRCLARWRSAPSLATAPLMWAATATISAPQRASTL